MCGCCSPAAELDLPGGTDTRQLFPPAPRREDLDRDLPSIAAISSAPIPHGRRAVPDLVAEQVPRPARCSRRLVTSGRVRERTGFSPGRARGIRRRLLQPAAEMGLVGEAVFVQPPRWPACPRPGAAGRRRARTCTWSLLQREADGAGEQHTRSEKVVTPTAAPTSGRLTSAVGRSSGGSGPLHGGRRPGPPASPAWRLENHFAAAGPRLELFAGHRLLFSRARPAAPEPSAPRQDRRLRAGRTGALHRSVVTTDGRRPAPRRRGASLVSSPLGVPPDSRHHRDVARAPRTGGRREEEQLDETSERRTATLVHVRHRPAGLNTRPRTDWVPGSPLPEAPASAFDTWHTYSQVRR